MIYAISGAQSVGKTTIINELKKRGYNVLSEITRELAKRGFKINEYGTDETQLEILKEHLRRLELDDVILDRSILDGIVYTHWLYEKGQVSYETLDKFSNEFLKSINKYDIIFYIKPEFDIVDDGQRSINKKFRDEIVELFDFYIDKYNIDVILISGSVEDRINTIIDSIEEKNINNERGING